MTTRRKKVGFSVSLVGAILLVLGIISVSRPVAQIAELITGSYSYIAMLYLIVGGLLMVGGFLVAVRKD